MKRLISVLSSMLLTIAVAGNVRASAQTTIMTVSTKNYTVQNGDSMWKICNKFQVGVSEVISLNPQISNPNNITPGNVLKIPNLDVIKAIENKVISIVNVERSKAGVSTLKGNWQLSRIARYKAEEMRDKNYFSHISPSFGSPFDMLKSFGMTFSAAGENIALGQQDPGSVMTSWMNSQGHKENILNVNYTEIGVGVAKGSNGNIYWVQQFIRR